MFMFADSIEALKNRDFHDAKAFVQSVLNQAVETVSDIIQKGNP